jgi:hypothetical protein
MNVLFRLTIIVCLLAIIAPDSSSFLPGNNSMLRVEITDYSYTYVPIVYGPPCVPPAVPLQNGGFELGKVSWIESDQYIIINSAGHSGDWMARFEDYTNINPASIEQIVTVPNCQPYLSFWFKSINSGFGRVHYFTVYANDVAAGYLPECMFDAWNQGSIDLRPWAGQTIKIKFERYVGDRGGWNKFNLDDLIFLDHYVPFFPWC